LLTFRGDAIFYIACDRIASDKESKDLEFTMAMIEKVLYTGSTRVTGGPRTVTTVA
jgi:hypothetical protein